MYTYVFGISSNKVNTTWQGEKTFIAWNWTKLFHFGKGFDVVRVPNLYLVLSSTLYNTLVQYILYTIQLGNLTRFDAILLISFSF